MPKVVFSVWRQAVVDNRSKSLSDIPETSVKDFPFVVGTQEPRAFVGWDGFIICDPSVNVVELMRAYFADVQGIASCGQCFPCRVGTRVVREILERIVSGKGKKEDIAKFESLANHIKASSKCQVGQTAPVPLLLALQHYREDFLRQIESPQKIERMKLLPHLTAPCTQGCPAHLDIPRYVEYIKNYRFLDSLEVIRSRGILAGCLGRVCVRPCELHCRRGLVDQPIGIKPLKRHVADYEVFHNFVPDYRAGPKRSGKVAIVGAGPAGLACAYRLARLGYDATIYEALPVAGGMGAVGIPAYRLPRDVLNNEVETIKRAGVKIIYNTRIGKDISFQCLFDKEKADAVFVGVGAHLPQSMGVEGEDKGYEGFVWGVDYLRELNLNRPMRIGERLAVVGGGNVAMDCVRCSLRRGFKEVNLIYRRSRAEMPADHEEIEAAEEEGVNFHFLVNPTRLITKENRVVGVELVRMELGEPDASGRRRPVPKAGSEFIMECDTVIPAIGQRTDLSFLGEASGLVITRHNTIEADPIIGKTSRANIFAGGDCVTGPATFVAALAIGNRTAGAIDKYLRGKPVEAEEVDILEYAMTKIKVYWDKEPIKAIKGLTRRTFSHADPQERAKTFDEVESVYLTRDAVLEARRCFRCYRLAGFLM